MKLPLHDRVFNNAKYTVSPTFIISRRTEGSGLELCLNWLKLLIILTLIILFIHQNANGCNMWWKTNQVQHDALKWMDKLPMLVWGNACPISDIENLMASRCIIIRKPNIFNIWGTFWYNIKCFATFALPLRVWNNRKSQLLNYIKVWFNGISVSSVHHPSACDKYSSFTTSWPM